MNDQTSDRQGRDDASPPRANGSGNGGCASPVSFELGRVVATRCALDVLTEDDVLGALRRHARGDWGEVCPGDEGANDRSLRDGTRLLSVYTSASGVTFWVITEADRSATTVLLPSDY